MWDGDGPKARWGRGPEDGPDRVDEGGTEPLRTLPICLSQPRPGQSPFLAQARGTLLLPASVSLRGTWDQGLTLLTWAGA